MDLSNQIERLNAKEFLGERYESFGFGQKVVPQLQGNSSQRCRENHLY